MTLDVLTGTHFFKVTFNLHPMKAKHFLIQVEVKTPEQYLNSTLTGCFTATDFKMTSLAFHNTIFLPVNRQLYLNYHNHKVVIHILILVPALVYSTLWLFFRFLVKIKHKGDQTCDLYSLNYTACSIPTNN